MSTADAAGGSLADALDALPFGVSDPEGEAADFSAEEERLQEQLEALGYLERGEE